MKYGHALGVQREEVVVSEWKIRRLGREIDVLFDGGFRFDRYNTGRARRIDLFYAISDWFDHFGDKDIREMNRIPSHDLREGGISYNSKWGRYGDPGERSRRALTLNLAEELYRPGLLIGSARPVNSHDRGHGGRVGYSRQEILGMPCECSLR
jgi:hypothetical protein